MNRITILSFIGQVFISVVVSGATIWARPIIDRDSKFSYLIEPPFVYQTLLICLLFIFSPQLFHVSKKLSMIIAKECFLAYHSIFKFKILDGFRRLTYALAITVAIGMLLHSLTVYAFSLAREIKYHA
jgi:hypothetical protein